MTRALIVIDMLNHYEHKDSGALVNSVRRALPGIRRTIELAKEEQIFTVYVNDNHGDWSAGRKEVIERALGGRHPSLVEPIAPTAGVPFVPKARHSAFYETQLEYMLRREEIDQLILVGQVTEQCIMYTALDAYVRHFPIVVPRDAVAHIHENLADAALRMMEINMRAEIVGEARGRERLFER